MPYHQIPQPTDCQSENIWLHFSVTTSMLPCVPMTTIPLQSSNLGQNDNARVFPWDWWGKSLGSSPSTLSPEVSCQGDSFGDTWLFSCETETVWKETWKEELSRADHGFHMEVKVLGPCSLNSSHAQNNLEDLRIPQVKTLGKNCDWKTCGYVEQETAFAKEGLRREGFF